MINNPDIRALLAKHGEVRIQTKNGKFSLIKNDGCFYYCINGLQVEISERKLDGIISRVPSGTGLIGWE